MRKPKTPPAPMQRSFLTVLLDCIVLFLALAGTVFSFATAFSLQARPLPLLLGCGICTLGAVFIFSLPWFRWVPPIFIALGWAWKVREMWDTLVLGEISLRCSVVNTFVASLEMGESIQPIAQLPEEVWQDACTALVLMAVVPLALLLGLSIVRARSFWLTALFCVPFLGLPLAITVTPDWVPLMAVLVSWGTLVLPSLTVRGGQKGYDRLRAVSLPVCILTLALLTEAMPQETYRRPGWADAANDELVNWAVRVGDEYFPEGDLFSGGMAAADQNVDLSNAGPLRYSGRTVLDVRSSDVRGRIYLRGFSSAVYEDNRWGPLEDADYTNAFGYMPLDRYSSYYKGGSADHHVDEPLDRYSSYYKGESADRYVDGPLSEQDDEQPDIMEILGVQPMNFPALAERETFPEHPYAKVTVRNVGASSGYVYVPYHILTTQAELSGAQFIQDSYVASEQGVDSHTFYIMPNCSPASGSAFPYASDLSLAERRYEGFVHFRYAQVPEKLEDTLNDWLWKILWQPEQYLPNGEQNEHYQGLFQENDSVTTMEHVIGLIADGLAFQCEYDPDTPATPEGEDFVEYFLTESHRGYCMHFASAAALLLRGVGIPTRYVSGYVADIPASGRALVPDANAHAWVEVYIDGYGWHPVEVTPAYAGGEPGVSGSNAEATPTPRPTQTPPPTRDPNSTHTPAPTPTPKPAEEAFELDPKVLGIGAAVLAVLALPFLRRALARYLRKRRFAGADTNRAAIDAYRYLERLARRGGSIPEEAQTLAEKAKFSQHTLTTAERDTIAALALQEAERLDACLPVGKRLALRYWFGLY